MKNVLMLTLIALIATSSYGQKCKLLDPKIDSFTGAKTVQTRYNIQFGYDKENPSEGIVLNFGIIKKLTQKDTAVFITFMVMPKFFVKITPDNTVDIKFEDGSVITLKSTVTREADIRLGDVQYAVSKSDVIKLQNSLIKMLRFSMQNKDGQTIYSNVSPYSDKNSKDFMFQLNCVLTN